MGQSYQIAFEIRAPSDTTLDRALYCTWRTIERQDDLLLDYVSREYIPKLRAELGALLKSADRGHDDGPVFRYFCSHYEKTPLTEVALSLLQDALFPAKSGFSGSWRIVPGSPTDGKESPGVRYSCWGDDERIYDSIFYDLFLSPESMTSGVNIL